MKVSNLLVICLLALSSLANANESNEILWPELIPEGWDPYILFEGYTEEEYANLSDEDYYALQDKAQMMLDKAPIVESLDGKRVKIPGFVLPLEFDGNTISEFLLVPYFGACIHTPPPPANQIIRGSIEKSFTMEDISRPVWITGKMITGRVSSKLGEDGYSAFMDVDSAYSMQVEEVEVYQ
ncbi:MAG: DUF3299 domain-containing protein [Pseudomonadota bacterium]